MKTITQPELEVATMMSVRQQRSDDGSAKDPLLFLIPDDHRVDDNSLALAEKVVGHRIEGVSSFDGTHTLRPNAAKVRAQLRRHYRKTTN